MTKAAFTSSCGDPFILLLGIKLFQERWYDEVDHYYININNHCGVPKEAISELLGQLVLDPKIHIIYHSRGRGNGPPITEMLRVCQEDLIVLIEDDAFIFEPGEISRCFQQIESGLVDIVGSPRFSCGVEIGEASAKKYGLDYTGYGDMGCNWWPNFFFCKREDLLKTDLDFGSHTWLPEEYSKELDYTFKEINHADTFGWACIQLRAMGLRSTSVPQHHASPFEITDKENSLLNWHPTQQPFKWIHGGSLSAGWGGYLSGRLPDVSHDSAKQEIETRCAFWSIAVSKVGHNFGEFALEYSKAIEDLIKACDLDSNRINEKVKIYRELMNV